MSFAAARESKRVRQTCQSCRDRSPSRGRFGAARKARLKYRGVVKADRDTVLCFECYRSEVNRQRAQRLALSEVEGLADSPFGRMLSAREVAHRRQMLDHLQQRTAGSARR
jgi:hypothetical protein